MENRCNTPGIRRSFYGWHNDAGLATQYKPQTVGNRNDGLAQDFVNENIEMVRKLSCDALTPMNTRVVMFSCWMQQPYIVPRKRGTIVLFDSVHNNLEF